MIKWLKKNLKFIILSFFVLTNAFIIFESTLPASISSQRSNFFTEVAKFIINGVTKVQEPDFIHVENVEVKDHLGNVINDDSQYEIPIGITRRFSAKVTPTNATNPNVSWSSSNPTILRVTSGGYLEARSLGENVEVIVRSAENAAILKKIKVDVVPKGPPTNFKVNLDTSDIMVGHSRRLTIDLLGQNTAEFDMTLLQYKSSNESVATINKYGVINALSVGTTDISIVNHDETYTLSIIDNPEPVVLPTTIALNGPSLGYVYSSIKLSYTFSEAVTDHTVTFVSSNEAIARVDHEGNVYGAKVSGTAVIKVYANADFRVYAEHTVTFNEVLPTRITVDHYFKEVNAGTKITIKATLHHDLGEENVVTNQEIRFESSDPSIAEVSSSNGNGIVLGIKKGKVTIHAYAEADPTVMTSVEVTVIPLKVINDNNIRTFGQFIRKAIGHFSLFLLNGVLGALTFTLFIRKKLYVPTILSLIPGVLVASMSELIQKFVDGRTASVYDVIINILGYFIGVLIVFLICIIIGKRKKSYH